MAGWIYYYEEENIKLQNITIDIEESYFLCPECSKMLFDHEEAADKFLRGQLMEEDDICPDY